MNYDNGSGSSQFEEGGSSVTDAKKKGKHTRKLILWLSDGAKISGKRKSGIDNDTLVAETADS